MWQLERWVETDGCGCVEPKVYRVIHLDLPIDVEREAAWRLPNGYCLCEAHSYADGTKLDLVLCRSIQALTTGK